MIVKKYYSKTIFFGWCFKRIHLHYRVLDLLMWFAMLFFSINQNVFSQGIGISSISITPDASSILEVRSTTLGMLIPRMTSGERDLIGTPASSLLIYNTSTNQFNYYDGSWKIIIAGLSSVTQGDLVYGSAANTISALALGSSGKILQSNGTNLIYSTPTFPLTAGTAGKILISDGTNIISSTPTFPNSAGTAGNHLISNGTNFVSAAVTTAQSTPVDPAGTSSLTDVMVGLAGSITPVTSGKILIIISGDIINDTKADGGQIQIRYGTGTAPVNAAALTGTAVGALKKFFNSGANVTGMVRAPFCLNAIVTGLTVNTTYWIDLEYGAITGGTLNIYDISISVVEL